MTEKATGLFLPEKPIVPPEVQRDMQRAAERVRDEYLQRTAAGRAAEIVVEALGDRAGEVADLVRRGIDFAAEELLSALFESGRRDERK